MPLITTHRICKRYHRLTSFCTAKDNKAAKNAISNLATTYPTLHVAHVLSREDIETLMRIRRAQNTLDDLTGQVADRFNAITTG